MSSILKVETKHKIPFNERDTRRDEMQNLYINARRDETRPSFKNSRIFMTNFYSFKNNIVLFLCDQNLIQEYLI
jgi:hypothetical protein